MELKAVKLKVPTMTGEQFKAGREKLGTRDEVALALGVSATTIWRLESTRGELLGLHACAMAYLLDAQLVRHGARVDLDKLICKPGQG